MELLFFIAHPDEVEGVASSDDLLIDLAAEPIPVQGPGCLLGLAAALGEAGRPLHQLRDATCRSYPIWVMSRAIETRIAGLDDEADLHERAMCFALLREALAEREEGARLYALLEERAF